MIRPLDVANEVGLELEVEPLDMEAMKKSDQKRDNLSSISSKKALFDVKTHQTHSVNISSSSSRPRTTINETSKA